MYYSNEEFKEWQRKIPLTDQRRPEFDTKLKDFLQSDKLSEILVKHSFIMHPFVVVGMMDNGVLSVGTDKKNFVSNGVPPIISDHDFKMRAFRLPFICATCCEVKVEGENYSLTPILSDKAVLHRKSVTKLFRKLFNKRFSCVPNTPLELCKLKLNNYTHELLGWLQVFPLNTECTKYLFADVDNTCVYWLSAEDIKSYRAIDDTRTKLCSAYSAYLFNGKQLIREEY